MSNADIADLKVTTTFSLEGYRIVKYLGVVRGITVRTRGIGGKIAAGLRGLVGGAGGSLCFDV